MSLFRVLLDPDPADKGGGNGSAGEGDFDAAKVVDSLAKRYGGLEGALKQLVTENHEHRTENRELKGRLPKDGSLVLDGDSVKHWNAYRELGSPSDIKKAFEERSSLQGQNANLLKGQVVGQAAKLSGFDETVLSTLVRDLEIEIQEKTEGDKVTRVATVKDGDKAVPLEDYAKRKWEKFLPALKPAAPTRPFGTPLGAGPGGAPPPPQGERKLYKGSPL